MPVHHVHAADSLDVKPARSADADAQPVAPDQTTPLVGDDVGDFGRVEAAMDAVGKCFQSRPELTRD